jgi:hypothetical protein
VVTRTQKMNEEMTFKKLLTGNKPVGLRNLDTFYTVSRNFENQVKKRKMVFEGNRNCCVYWIDRLKSHVLERLELKHSM